jgi:C4-dicarboxylate-binding protein DctP
MRRTSLGRRAAVLVMCLAAAAVTALPARAAEMVLTSEIAVTHWKTRYMSEFVDAVKTRTGGALAGKLFPASQLYNDQDALAALGTGAVQMVWPLAVRLETIDPRAGIVNLPFTLSDGQMQDRCCAKGVAALLSGYLEPRGLGVLGLLRTADLLFVFKNKEIGRLEDMKGTKVRVTGGRVFLDMMRALDASPVSMPASEMGTALSQGAIDGVLTSPAGWSENIGISAKYAWYVPGMSLGTYAVVVDRGWFEGLPANERRAITESIDSIAARQWKEAIDADAKIVEKMKAQGAVYRTASADEIRRWKDRAAAGNKTFVEKHPDAAQALAALETRCPVKK